MSLQVSHLVTPGSVLLLVARSGTLLQELKEELRNVTKEEKLVVRCITADLSTREGVNDTVAAAKREAVDDIDHVLLINNAGEPQVKEMSLFQSVCLS